ncbi:MAG: hypothetical protein CBE21_00730 [Proteobacteria bacterium TMED261]|jgi:hypothetical protein|nr:MAG: hypothetical protein CBE21_00730 [Proteobacteria bacterium TMED261]|tara:strand:- start:607 stop:876 length:270 start_codon:yes stop_codon:yes gene_type:complete
MMKKWYQILWGSREEDELVQRVQQVENKLHGMGDITDEPAYQKDADPDELTIENAYKTRWIWYHTILGLLMLMANMIMLAIFLLLAIKL